MQNHGSDSECDLWLSLGFRERYRHFCCDLYNFFLDTSIIIEQWHISKAVQHIGRDRRHHFRLESHHEYRCRDEHLDWW
ncbi:hypothetical protein RQP46_007827 [Phenoliferia psychrophenolica]